MSGAVNDQTDLSPYEKNDVIKIQAIIRGCLCRDRVNKKVQKLIDEILLRREMSSKAKEGKGNKSGIENGDVRVSSVSGTQTTIIMDTDDDTQKAQQPTNNNQKRKENSDDMKHAQESTRSLGLIEIKPNSIKESFMTNDDSVLQGSVSSILSKFEAKINPNAPAPTTTSWSTKKIQGDKREEDKNQENKTKDDKQEEKKQENYIQDDKQEEKQDEEKQLDTKGPMTKDQPQTIEKLQFPKEEEKDLEIPTERPKSSVVKNMKLRSNATKNVSSSAKVLEEQGMRMDGEIQQLLKDIKRVGDPEEPTVSFGELFDDEKVANYYEALVGTLKAAKKKKLIEYEGQYLLKGMNDKVVISIL